MADSLPAARLAAMEKRFQMLEAELAAGPEAERYGKVAADYAELEPIVAAIRELHEMQEERKGVDELLADAGSDAEMRRMAEAEAESLDERIANLTENLRVQMLPKDEADARNVILEIRAGTGGDEAALFAGDLFRMYERYSADQGWKVSVDSMSEGEAGGYKEIIAEISGRGVFAKMKFESGVHRVQRVPATEAGGRIHTSAATVAVLPEAEEVDVEIADADIRIDTMRSSGAGGQHVNTTDSAVRITHLPSGIVVLQSEKSQHQNRARAMQILRARLYDLKRSEADAERSESRRAQVGSGDRSERIRTYNFPQGRVTDHRINLTLYKLDRVIDGDLGELIDALIADHQASLLAEMQ